MDLPIGGALAGRSRTLPGMTKARRAFGAWGERTAEAYLRRIGMAVLDRNWRCRQGEVDLVALDAETVVFCEVKARRGAVFGAGVGAIPGRKARRLRLVASAWLAAHAVDHRDVRFDVVGVRPGRTAPVIDHVKGAF